MYKISELISLPVLNIYEGEFEGIVYNIVFDCNIKKCKYACILNEDEGIKKILKLTDIFKISKDSLLIKNNSVLSLECSHDNIISKCTTPLNLKVYNIDGEFIGKCTDVNLDKNFKIESIIINQDKIIPTKEIMSLGKSLIFTNDTPIKISKFKPKFVIKTQNETNQNKIILLNNNNTPTQIEQKTNHQTKIITDYSFLIGRILERNIIATNGEILAKKNSVITKEIVNKTSLYGKLAELSRYSMSKQKVSSKSHL